MAASERHGGGDQAEAEGRQRRLSSGDTERQAPGPRRLPEDSVRRFRNRWRGLRAVSIPGSRTLAPRLGVCGDPAAPMTFRDGLYGRDSWNNNPRNLRSANRNRNQSHNGNNNQGFLIARTPLRSRSRRVHRRAGKGVQGRPC